MSKRHGKNVRISQILMSPVTVVSVPLSQLITRASWGCGGQNGWSHDQGKEEETTQDQYAHEFSQYINASGKWIATTLQPFSGMEGTVLKGSSPCTQCYEQYKWSLTYYEREKSTNLWIQRASRTGRNGLATLPRGLVEAKLKDCLGTVSLYGLSHLPFLTVLFLHSRFPKISRILIRYAMNFCLSFGGNQSL